MAFEIVAASRNQGKLAEIKNILDIPGINLISLLDYPQIGPIPEEGETFEENALSKARTVYHITGKITLADDSGLCVDALDGGPGVFSARYSGKDTTDEANNMKLLRELENVPDEKRSARFVCVIALVAGDKELAVRGECEGIIIREVRGDHGFGYDPLFYYPPARKTFSEMDPLEKNRISHRAAALELLKGKLPAFLESAG